MPFIRGMADQPHWLGVMVCTQATLGDAAIALTAFLGTANLAKTRNWVLRPHNLHIVTFLGVSVVMTVLFEAMATGVLGRQLHLRMEAAE